MVKAGIIDPAKVTKGALRTPPDRLDDPDDGSPHHRCAGEGEGGATADAGLLGRS
jgi:hypothetical protein